MPEELLYTVRYRVPGSEVEYRTEPQTEQQAELYLHILTSNGWQASMEPVDTIAPLADTVWSASGAGTGQALNPATVVLVEE